MESKKDLQQKLDKVRNLLRTTSVKVTTYKNSIETSLQRVETKTSSGTAASIFSSINQQKYHFLRWVKAAHKIEKRAKRLEDKIQLLSKADSIGEEGAVEIKMDADPDPAAKPPLFKWTDINPTVAIPAEETPESPNKKAHKSTIDPLGKLSFSEMLDKTYATYGVKK